MSLKEMKLPRLAYNWISGAGIIIALVTAVMMTFLYIIGIFAKVTNPYLGIFLYMVLPPVLISGLIMVPVGMYKTWRRFKKTGEISYPTWPYFDLNKKSHRNAAAIFASGSIFFLIVTAIGGYEAFHYTESVTFCGKTCHSVMKPEFVAYQNSPHARVACVSCHVGPGADWYAKSKLSGLYQVYAVIRDIYPRPIPTPIANLRPARETCEQCHWPEKFFGNQQKSFVHYMYDEGNREWPIDMIIKVGGGNPETGLTSGIHWHTFINNKIEYIARDEKRQDIPWVRATNVKTGKQTVYQNTDNPLTEEEIASGQIHVFDCMDCHNRPSHIYNSPDHAIDEAIFTNKIDRRLPEMKRIAVEAMAKVYESEEEARHGIANKINDFYVEEYPEIYKNMGKEIEQSILETQNQFSKNIFPGMKVRWDEYPNNLGHFNNPGCMRCHTGEHFSKDGAEISRDCNSCHIILSQGSGDDMVMAKSMDGMEFIHPEDIDEAWKEMDCFECHTGTQP
ncbi:MAG: NapC/NirT family cytochrome c [Candidatus Zixiibacteriota bacterium]